MTDWCHDLAQQIVAQSPSNTVNIVANEQDPVSHVPSQTHRISPNVIVQCWSSENSVRQDQKKFENLPEDL